MIYIIDYGAGNLRSVSNAFARLKYPAQIVNKPDGLLKAEAVILPGVGAAADTMAGLQRIGMVDAIKDVIKRGTPFLGICIGLQVLFTGTEEGGWHECMDIIPGKVIKLPPGDKIPHMGWNQVRQKKTHPVFNGIPDESNFYFVHSYHGVPDDKSLIIGETDYGTRFCSVVARDNLIATQFHPEKSGDIGIKFYDNFIRFATGKIS